LEAANQTMIHPTPINVWYWPTPPNALYLTPQSVPDAVNVGAWLGVLAMFLIMVKGKL